MNIIKKSISLITILFCMSATAVNNPISHAPEVNDVDVFKYNGEYYLSGNWLRGDMLRSRDLMSWGERKHIFSWNNSWHTAVNQSNQDFDIHGTHIRYLNGVFHFFAHLDVSSGITHATSSNVWGPYIETKDEAFTGRGWLIDADTFVDDDGSLFFYETNRGGSSGHEIHGRTMSNLSTLSGSWDLQIQDSQGWEGNVINEGSKVFKYRDRYYMLYNGEGTGNPNYAIGAVEASSPLGFSNSGKYADNPVIGRATPAPGKPEITHIGQPWVVEGLNGFEKWFGYFAVTTADGRTQRIDRMHFFNRKLFIDGPTDRWSTGYHPDPAKPLLLNIFSLPDGLMPANDWVEQTSGAWSVVHEEAVQSSQSTLALNTINRESAINYLIEANLKFTQAPDAEDKAGVLAFYEDEMNFVLVGLDRSGNSAADNWYVHVKEDGVDTVYSGSYAGSVDYNVYHKIRVTKNSGQFDIRIDDMIPPNHSTISTTFLAAGIPGIYTDHAAAAFDGILYTIGWDEFDSGMTGWGDGVNGVPEQGNWSVGSSGITMSNGTGYTFKGDLMHSYEFSTQVYKEGAVDGRMGIYTAAIDLDNHAYAFIDLATNELVMGGVKNGTALTEQRTTVADKNDYNIRAVKLADKIIVFVDGIERLTMNETFEAAQPGLWTVGMSARYNGIMVYRTESNKLPAPWVKTDIGPVGFPGSAYHYDNAIYMSGSGADIWNSSDEFTFSHKDSSGDWEISTRVVNLDDSDYWAKAGLMFRDDLSAGSSMVMVLATPGDDGIGPIQMVFRDEAGSAASAIHVPAELPFPIWLKLNRQENTFSGYYSSDGLSWVLIGSRAIPLDESGKLGLAVTSHNNDRMATAVFDNLSMATAATPNTPPIFTVDPVVKDSGLESSAYVGTLSNDATDADSDPLSFSLISGPSWLSVAANGELSGTPEISDIGMNSFSVQVDDGRGGSDSAELTIFIVDLETCAATTALQGTADENSLGLLRHFRDRVLKPNAIGSEFVAFYYRVSPSIAAWLNKNEGARQIAGAALGGVVDVIDYFYEVEPNKQKSQLAVEAEGTNNLDLTADLYRFNDFPKG